MQRIRKIISWILIIAILIVGYQIFSKYNFNRYTKAEYIAGNSEFLRDNKEKYNKTDSYKVENKEYNDAIFYQTIEVAQNTPYKVSCMIKTKDVENEKQNADAGASICIIDSTEKSDNLQGTTDWTKIEFLFNSGNRTQVNIGFRLGSFESNSKGTAWFSEMKIEQGLQEESKEWNFLALMFDNLNVMLENGSKVQFKLDTTDKEDMKLCMNRFQTSLAELSESKIMASYQLVEITDPITSMSYDEENGYYVSPTDIKNIVDSYIHQGKYDHIFVIFKYENGNVPQGITMTDWIGLGGMEYRNVGYSNIRLPATSTEKLIYQYDYRYNLFPEEVFLHEFLHTLERNSKKYGYERPELHSYSDYGYKEEKLVRLKKWYQDYMNRNITVKGSNEKVGLDTQIYKKRPVKESDFTYSLELKKLEEPANIIEQIRIIIEKVVQMFKNIGEGQKTNIVKS